MFQARHHTLSALLATGAAENPHLVVIHVAVVYDKTCAIDSIGQSVERAGAILGHRVKVGELVQARVGVSSQRLEVDSKENATKAKV